MDQETLVNELKTRVGDTDLSERTVTEVAKNALPMFADDSKITDDLWNFTVGTVKSAMGQERAERKSWIAKQQETLAASDKAEREKWQKEFEEKWAKEHPTAAPPQTTAPSNGGDEDKVAKALEAYNKKLFGEDGKSGLIGAQLATTSEFIQKSNAQAKEAKIGAMRKELKDYLVGKNASREPVINLAVKEMALDENSDIDKAKIEVEKSYEAKFKEFYGDGAKPYGGPSAGGGENGVDGDLKKYIQDRAKTAEKEAADAESLRKKFR